MLEQRVRRLATAQVDALARARPALAVLETEGGAMQVPVAQLQPGDTIRVAHGETVPADAVLLEAEGVRSTRPCSAGNPPLHRVAGDAVYAGSLCHGRAARLRVTGTGAGTRSSELRAPGRTGADAAVAPRPPRRPHRPRRSCPR
ncbi:MAG: hypothetical protein U1F20_04540 [Lysobacterales bacterium]